MDSCLSRISDNQVARISFFCGMKVIKKMRIFHMKQHYCAHFGKNQNSVKHEKTKVLMKAEDTLLLNHRIHPIQFCLPGIISGRIGGRFLATRGY